MLSEMSVRNQSAKVKKQNAEKEKQKKIKEGQEAAISNKFAKDFDQVIADMSNQDGFDENSLISFD